MKRVYLDFAASTPTDKKVLKAMEPYFFDVFGNAGSLHSFGQEASAAVFTSRRKIADLLGVSYSEIVFTGSATEANNLALKGALNCVRNVGTAGNVGVDQAKRSNNSNKRSDRTIPTPKLNIVVSAIEHESVLETAKALKAEDVELRIFPVLKSGQIDLKKLEKAMDKHTSLVSIMYANNEVGSILPIKKIAKIIKGKAPQALFHTDAVQAFQYLDCRPEELGVDLMTLSSHKIYGPKGVGILYARKGIDLNPIIFGGGQENGMRSGTENTASIVGFAKAIELANDLRGRETKRICELRDWFLKELVNIFPKAKLNGAKRRRLPNNINLNLGDISSEQALTFLDLNGVAVSAGSACSARSLEASKALLAIGISKKDANSSIRITLGRSTSKDDLKKTLGTFKKLKKAFA